MSSLRILHVTPYSAAAWGYGGIPRVVGGFTQELRRRGHHVTVLSTDARDAEGRLALPSRNTATSEALTPPTPLSRSGRGGSKNSGLVPPLPLRERGLGGEGSDDQDFPKAVLASSSEDSTWICPNLSNHLAYHHQLFLPLGMLSALRRIASEFDIAHLHACHNLPSVFAARELRRAGVPWVLGPNGTAPRIERRIAAKGLFDAVFGRAALERASRVLAVSYAEELQLRALEVEPERIARVPNPIDVAEIEMRPEKGVFRQRYGLGDAPLVVYLGKLTPRKRLDVLIDAFARLERPARLVVAGNDMGVESALRRQARERGVEVLFTGLLEGVERFGALVDADVVVYPSEHEIFGLVPLEALLCGTPVIVADDSGCGEVVREVGGRVVPLGDVEALRLEIEAVLANPAVPEDASSREVSDAAAQVRRLFGVKVVVDRLEEVYREVLE